LSFRSEIRILVLLVGTFDLGKDHNWVFIIQYLLADELPAGSNNNNIKVLLTCCDIIFRLAHRLLYIFYE